MSPRFRGKIQSQRYLTCLDEVQLERTRTLELGWTSSFGFWCFPQLCLLQKRRTMICWSGESSGSECGLRGQKRTGS